MYSEREFFAHEIDEAAAWTGSLETLALILNVAVQDLAAWRAGLGRPPAEVALRLSELLGEH